MTATVESAYRRCEEITWSQARNFAYGIRLLPPAKRRAMAALYAMARRIDDIGDGDWPEARKLSALGELQETIGALEAGRLVDPTDDVLVALSDAAGHYPIPVAALHEIVEGCELDVRGETYFTLEDTVRYCRLVAGSVGRLSLGIFGANAAPSGGAGAPACWPRPFGARRSPTSPRTKSAGDAGAHVGARPAEELADDLGVALQLTNMLRDIVEDQQMGRIYLPELERQRFGVAPGEWAPPEAAAETVRFVAGHAAGWFERGLPLLDRLDHRSRACTAAMAGIYRRLLQRILADPAAPLRTRVRLPASQKGLVAVRSLSGLRP